MLGTLVFDILRINYINKLKSARLSIRHKSLFCAAHKSKIIIDKSANISIKDGLFFNMCWDGKQNQPGTLTVAENSNLNVRHFRTYGGTYISVAPVPNSLSAAVL